MWLAKVKRKVFRHYRLVRTFLFITLLFTFVFLLVGFLLPVINLTRIVLPVVLSQETSLREVDGRTNILILGAGGKNQNSADLTDTMLLLSVKTKLTDIETVPAPVFISIPRDIYSEDLGDKINSAYHQGESKKSGSGLVLAKSVISRVTGLPIHYSVLIDFTAFEKAIDLLGGIDLTVERTFDDYLYPLVGKETDLCGLSIGLSEESYPCRFEHIHFEAGPTHLTGSLALKFARSRHATGDEGNDFARARRQQLVLKAVVSKVFSLGTLLQPQKLNEIYVAFKDHISTDISDQEMNSFLKLALKYKNSSTRSVVLDDTFFINPPPDSRGWILLPRDGSFFEIHKFISEEISKTNQNSSH